MASLGARLELGGRYLIWGVLRFYQLTFSFWLGGRCRFTPTCSHYMQEAVLIHGVAKGLKLGLIRLGRCGPGGGHGFDPVPPIGYECPHQHSHSKRKTPPHAQ